MIQTNVIHHSYLQKVTKLMFLGSSCIYPKMAPQPLKEAYATAKIAGIKCTMHIVSNTVVILFL